MIGMPETERIRFESILRGHAARFGMSEEDYLRKIWYHEEAQKVGEYAAMNFLHELLRLLPSYTEESGS